MAMSASLDAWRERYQLERAKLIVSSIATYELQLSRSILLSWPLSRQNEETHFGDHHRDTPKYWGPAWRAAVFAGGQSRRFRLRLRANPARCEGRRSHGLDRGADGSCDRADYAHLERGRLLARRRRQSHGLYRRRAGFRPFQQNLRRAFLPHAG